MDPRLTSELTDDLKEIVVDIESHSKDYGLDFFPVIFEMVDYAQMSEIAAYGGFPTRYPHWRFGMEYEQLSKSYEYGLSLIYEMVINNDPCYAYLLKSNSLVDQKTVIAHVYGHCDFFKNNYSFAHTNRKMLDEMANHGSRIRSYIEEIGWDPVEDFIDTCLSIENLIDQNSPHIRRVPASSHRDDHHIPPERRPVPKIHVERPYMESYINPPSYLAKQREVLMQEFDREKRFPEEPQRDVLQFLIDHAPLNNWQRDILSVVREEAYYFAPQGQTKIMNEGWAVYWHSKIMNNKVLRDSEVIDYCDHYAGVVATSPMRINPYKMGVDLFRYIEQRWNKGQFGVDWLTCDDPAVRRAWNHPTNLGRKKIFEIRKHYNDITFIDEFLTEDFCEDARMFNWAFDRRSGQAVMTDREFKQIKQNLLESLTNFGQPIIEVVDGNYRNRGELLLLHRFYGRELKLDRAFETMRSLWKVWTRPIYLATLVEGEARMLVCDGGEPRVEKLPEAAS
jgi:stage V sporulation protein R